MSGSRAFSLIEVIIVVAISALVAGALANIFFYYNSSYLYQNASVNVSSSAASFLNEMSELALQAKTISTSRAVSGTTYTTGSTTVVFELPAMNSSGDVLPNAYDYAILYATSTHLYRILDVHGSSVRKASTVQYSDVLSNLTLTYDNATPANATSITVDLSTATTSRGKTAATQLKQTVYLRNK